LKTPWPRVCAALFAAVILVAGSVPIPGFMSAANENNMKADKSDASSEAAFPDGSPAIREEPYYYDKLNEWKKKGVTAGTEQLKVAANRFVRSSDDVKVGTYKGESGVVLFSEPKGWVEFELDAASDGLYEFWVEYAPFSQEEGGNRQPLVVSVTWNGAYPFVEAKSAKLTRYFKDRLPEKFDEEGNQVRALTDELNDWRTEPFRDSEGAYAQPLQWHVNKGTNVIRIEASMQPFALKSIAFKPAEAIPSYRDVRAPGQSTASTDVDMIVLEAEQMAFKSSTSILTRYDRDPLTTPKSLDLIRFNTLGGPYWSKGGQKVGWKFSVPADGMYKIGFRANQSFRKNLISFRTIAIDGKVLFRELLNFPFRYRSGWSEYVLANDQGVPYEIFLTKGEHTLEMQANYEPYMPVIDQIDQISEELRAISIDIRSATGNREDRYRAWDVETKMPWLIERFASLEKRLRELSGLLVAINGAADNVSQAILATAKDISELLKDPDNIPNSQLDIGVMQQRLDSQRTILMQSPLQLDKIYIVPAAGKFPRMKANLAEKIAGTLATLLHSFRDRNQFGKQRDDELNVWMFWGRDYVDSLQQLADEQFTPKYGIKVRINLVQSADLLILAQAAGILPDVALGVPSDKPFELAIRDVALDLTSMPGGKELLAKYHPGTLLPYYYRQGYYGIPETMNHKVLFYRKDILRQLGLEVPNTWDDVFLMLPTLLQNNYNFYIDPNDFTALFFQNDAEIYERNGLRTALNQPAAHRAFKMWTDLFTKYGLEREVASFYNHFRRGTMPIGIADFNQYMQLLVAAPEIMNEWGIAPVPGTVQPDGTVARWIGGVNTVSAMLFKQTPEHKREQAWQFLRWYLSDEIQTEYGLHLEQYGGETFRWNSANIRAFANMPWRPEDLNVFLEQWQWYKEVPNVPGGYMTKRQLQFAWNRTTINYEPPRTSLEKAVREINRELLRKQQEFHIVDQDGNMVQTLDLPQINESWKGANPDGK